MTQHVRAGYRRHRKGTWGLALFLVLAAAAAVIPLANGARPPTYTFTGDAGDCAGTTSTSFDVVLANTSASPQNLGSADLYAPSIISVTSASIASGGGSTATIAFSTYPNAVTPDPNDPTSTGRSLISLRNLTVAPGSSVTVHVAASVNVTGAATGYWYSVVKQANQFNPGTFDTSNNFSLQGSNPKFTVAACTLQFVQQPPNPWQKGSTAADQNSSPFAVAVFAGNTRVAVSGTPTPTVTPGSDGTTSDFSFGSASYNSSTLSWAWPGAKPNSTAPHGNYNLDVTLGSMSTTSDSNSNSAGNQPFQVVDQLCQTGVLCTAQSNPDPNAEGTGTVTLTDPFADSIFLNFIQPDPGDQSCSPWNRASYTDSSNNTVYFPGVALNYNWGQKMLQVNFYVRNSEWVQTNVSRGNQDADFCVAAHHQVQTNLNDGHHPFVGKYPGGVQWDSASGNYVGVLASVANPSKVKTDGTGSPAICQRGTTYLNTGPGGAPELWRFWTGCIPYDWDYTSKGP
jgi:hypothetical protein